MKYTAIFLLAILPSIVLGRSIPEKNYEEGDLFQGDIRLLPGQLDKNGMLLDEFYWPNATIYYQLEGIFESDESKKEMVLQAMEEFHAKTCIRFEPHDGTHSGYIAVSDIDANGCSAFIGRLGLRQPVELKVPGCDKVGTIIHELMHAVGFFHEQARMDRDDYVDIIWENIEFGQELNFMIMPSTPFNVSYDYGSIMHYGPKSFSANGNDTIVPKDPEATIGQRDGLSEKDAIKINKMYNCTEIDGFEY